MSGALAVTERLNSRGLNVDATCKLCNNADETINHVLFQCQPALDILESVLGLGVRVFGSGSGRFLSGPDLFGS